ncbi:MAG: hypothetical protein QXP26_06395 [Fervidicoccaceae archaeon]
MRIATGAYRVLHGIQIKDNDFNGKTSNRYPGLGSSMPEISGNTNAYNVS